MSAPDNLVRDALEAQVEISHLHADNQELCWDNLVLGALPPSAMREDLPLFLDAQGRMLTALIAGRTSPQPAIEWEPKEPDALRSEYERTVVEFAGSAQATEAETVQILTDQRFDRGDRCAAYLAFFDYVIGADTTQAALMRRLFLGLMSARGSLLAFMVK